jgi:hypothetical protein
MVHIAASTGESALDGYNVLACIGAEDVEVNRRASLVTGLPFAQENQPGLIRTIERSPTPKLPAGCPDGKGAR